MVGSWNTHQDPPWFGPVMQTTQSSGGAGAVESLKNSFELFLE